MGVNRELAAIQAALGYLHSEVAQLREENRRLQGENDLLSEKQASLLSSMEQRPSTASMDWAAFDAVEEHYREVDRQNSSKEENNAVLRQADGAAGSPVLAVTKELPGVKGRSRCARAGSTSLGDSRGREALYYCMDTPKEITREQEVGKKICAS